MKKHVATNRPLWVIRKYKKGDNPGILKLFRLGGVELTKEGWPWKYRGNPFSSFIWVGECNGQIVGHTAYSPVHMKFGEKRATATQAVDVIVHPKFRRQGMCQAIANAQREEAQKTGIAILYGFPNRPTVHQRYGCFVVCKIPYLAKFIKTTEMANLLERKYRIPRAVTRVLLQIFSTITAVFARVHSRINNMTKDRSNSANIEIRAITSFDDRINDFWKRVSRRYDIIAIRKREYLNWRYSKNPDAQYRILLAEKKEKIMGYIVLRHRNEKNLKLGYIVDILASSRNAAQSLISKAVEYFKKENVDTILCYMLKGNDYYRILRYNNFIPIGSTWFMVRIDSPWVSKTFVGDATKWYVTMGDSDHI